jgi:alginate O-acetyltransferase complex protein AlgI
MIFLTYWFVVFVALTLPAYWLVSHRPTRLALLLVMCVVFHTHFAGPAGVIPILVLGVSTYLAARSRNRHACLGVMILCVASLVFYKYTRFICAELVASLSSTLGASALAAVNPLLPAAPPLAISFFVFEFVHYLLDVRRGEEPLSSPLDFSLFALFWPSIVAGPVKRYQQFVPALHAGVRKLSRHDVSSGVLLVALGLVKKLVADNLTAYLAVRGPEFGHLPLGDRWFVFASIGLRILWDFSGYSDMAIGFARMLGVELPANFNWPYLAPDLRSFWDRWHISLSRWIRDYVYIPLGGSRRGLARKVLNALIAFGACGLWHGAAFHFLVWGLFHGLGLAVSSSYANVTGAPGRVLHKVLTACRPLSWALTMLFVGAGWLLFFYPVSDAWAMFRLLFTTRQL